MSTVDFGKERGKISKKVFRNILDYSYWRALRSTGSDVKKMASSLAFQK